MKKSKKKKKKKKNWRTSRLKTMLKKKKKFNKCTFLPYLQSPSLTLDSPEVPSTRLSSTAEFETKLAQLEEMGWSDRRQNIKALLNAKGDVVEAVESLLLL